MAEEEKQDVREKEKEDSKMEQKADSNKKSEKKSKADDNVVYVGKKGVINYVMATITQLNKGEKEVHVKARGRSISKAVDVVQLLKNRFEEKAQIKSIEIGTEEVEADEGGKINVSTIDIVVSK